MSDVTRNLTHLHSQPMSLVFADIDDVVLVADNPVDLSHLRRYTMGNAALENEVLTLFLQQLPHTIASLESAKTADDWRFSTHTLKGSARAVGAWPLAQLAAQAEQLCPIRDDRACHDLLARIAQGADDLRQFIETPSSPSK